MKKSTHTSILEKLYTVTLFGGVLLSSVVLSNTITEADNLFGERCGPDLVCSGEQTCQLQLNGQPVGTLPGQTQINVDPTTGDPITDISYQCIDPPQLPAPNSPYRGPQIDGYNTSNPRPSDPGVPVNIINQGPVPVDIFNPLPVPTNIVSPNPVPVVVVDDLALYQQARIDEYVTERTKDQTLAESTAVAVQEAQRTGVVQNRPLTYENTVSVQAAQQETIQQIVENPPAFIDTAAAIEGIETLAQERIQTEGRALGLQPSAYTDSCPADPTNSGLACTVLALRETPMNFFLQAAQNLSENTDIAAAQLDREYRVGDGYYPVTDEQNPLEQAILTPAKHVAETMQKFLESKIDQVLGATGNCTEAQGLDVLEQTIEPIFQDGLYQITGAIDFDNIDITNPEASLQQIGETLRQTGEQIFQALLQGISCELGAVVNDVIGPWLDDVLDF